MKSHIRHFVCLIAIIALVAGCAVAPDTVTECMDRADELAVYYVAGMEHLEEGDLADGAAALERVLSCDNKHSLSQGGMAIVEAVLAKGMKEAGDSRAMVKSAHNHLARALKAADSPAKLFAYHLAAMRVITALKREGWLSRVEGSFEKAMQVMASGSSLPYYRGRVSAPYFMGVSYLKAGAFGKAKRRLSDVMDMDNGGPWGRRAETGWNRADDLLSALSGRTLGDVGRRVALQSSVERGELAALLVDELDMIRLLAGSRPKAKTPVADNPLPTDIITHHGRKEILLMIKWGVRGLEPFYDETTESYLFRPDGQVTRGELAIVLEDILIKISGDEEMRTVYIGEANSPFSDIHVTVPRYNAVRNVTTRNLMRANSSGAFRPNDIVDGVEVIEAITVLRQRMNIE